MATPGDPVRCSCCTGKCLPFGGFIPETAHAMPDPPCFILPSSAVARLRQAPPPPTLEHRVYRSSTFLAFLALDVR